MKHFPTLIALCKQIAQTRPNPTLTQQRRAAEKLHRVLCDWSEENENSRRRFDTDPHGEQSLLEINPAINPAGSVTFENRLFRLRDKQGHFLVMTGEELLSLSKQLHTFVNLTP